MYLCFSTQCHTHILSTAGTTPPAANMTTGQCTDMEWEGVQALNERHVQYHSKNQIHTYIFNVQK